MARKSPTGDADAFQKLLADAKAAGKDVEPPITGDPTATLIESFFVWNATVEQADLAMIHLMDVFVDFLELRVALPHEFLEIIGEDYPFALERVIRLRDSMYEVYLRERGVELKTLLDKNKKEQRAYLDSLPGIPPFVAARTALLSFEAHGVPVDDKLCLLMIERGVFAAGTTPAEAEAFLQKQVKAADASETYLALQAWSDRQAMPAVQAADSDRVGFEEVAAEAEERRRAKTRAKAAAKSKERAKANK